MGRLPKNTGKVVVIDERCFLEDEPCTSDAHVIDFRDNSWVICFTGRRGGGKTSVMTHMIVLAACLDPTLKMVTNYPVEFYIRRSNNHLSHYKSEMLDWYKLLTFDEDYKGCIIAIDEAADQINCMAAQTLKNRLVSAFVRQLRKNMNSLFMASQEFELIDRSMRWQTDIVCECQDTKQQQPGADLEKGECIYTEWQDNSG